ncbi:MAG: hypothetical protein EON56_05595 [Alphaproteobacteria bacterium]|nr:MAG: hypothetical protein EON56_05595 [Alphaproteobacteria bacterium]
MRRDEWQAANERKDHDARRVANWLLTTLGRDKFEEFRSELSGAIAGSTRIVTAIERMDPASIQATDVAIAEEKAETEAAVSSAGIGSVGFGSF